MTDSSVSLRQCIAWLSSFDALVTEHAAQLSELDAAIGDGDHGSNLAKGMTAVIDHLAAAPAGDIAELFKGVGMTLVSPVGGASGPLYGTFFLRFGMSAGDASELDGAALGTALRAGLEGVVARGKAELGDKTMFDAMLPAIEAYDAAIAAGSDLAAAARAAHAAARAGRDSTLTLVARKGRASAAGERTGGHLDPGAASTALLFEALAAVLAGAELHRELEVINPDGLHARPAAVLVEALAGLDARVSAANIRTGKPAVAVTGPTSVLILGARFGDRLVFGAEGADAARALAIVERLMTEGFGELAAAATEPASRPPASRPRVATGPLGVSPGRAVGPVLRMPEPLLEPQHRAPGDLVAESERLKRAMKEVATVLRDRAALVSGEAREILKASALMAIDETLEFEATTLVSGGESAERAAWLAISGFADQLAEQGGRMAERVADVHDLRNRVVSALLGRPAPGVPESSEPFVLVARDLAPADTALLDRATCLAIITAHGGPTSHTAILARSLGIPAIVAAPEALNLVEGTLVFVDGSSGRFEANPSAELIEEVRHQPALAVFDGVGATKDKHRIALLANVGSLDSVAEAAASNAEGVGLFRTEFCFLDRDTAPTIDEQVAAYRPVFAAFTGRRVIVRTLDAGADKPLAFVTDSDEANPALGLRGIRTAWRYPELLDQQLAAIARAAAAERADVWVMAPMIASVDEAEDFVSQCRSHGLTTVGAMVETPAAAIMATELSAVVDFVSLGTNDLAQYTMAADRLLGDLAALNDPWQPAVLRLIAMTAEAGAAAGKPVGVCGEAAANPFLAAVLVGLGVTSLSMAPRAIGAVAAQLASATLKDCQRAAEAARLAPTAAAARHAALAILVSLPVG